ncbi:D-serine ammonia-lyase [Marinomonas sp. 2405UD68-3]|uniref:D-serine ammonia-lyase n=1 Tax=Marinomonas sp. 2405UD68-3 TaxID=3391835 RepID=UPI0039C9B5AA
MSSLNISKSDQESLCSLKPVFWTNGAFCDQSLPINVANTSELYEAADRFLRFAPVLERLFPELSESNGLIESPLLEVPLLNKLINSLGGSLYVKADHALPVAGSIKARGGIHEVLCFAEKLALDNGLVNGVLDDYSIFLTAEARAIFSQYTIAVGSTGNLGLSIGIAGSALGFKTVVHMSSDAKEWKKTRLRKRGVKVVEHDADYGVAVEAGRSEAEADRFSYFVDDERSSHLFMGYAVAALRLQEQLKHQNIPVDEKHPLFVYLPAGVGGAPGGITFGLKTVFGDHAHCFFAEPVQAPCMLLGMAGDLNTDPTPVYEYGLTIDTDADGLAVGTASQWVCDVTRHLLSGVFTATDKQLYQHLHSLKSLENIEVEPSAAIGCQGPLMLNSQAGQEYLKTHRLLPLLSDSTHIAWLTGGSFVPKEEYQRYLDKAVMLQNE